MLFFIIFILMRVKKNEFNISNTNGIFLNLKLSVVLKIKSVEHRSDISIHYFIK